MPSVPEPLADALRCPLHLAVVGGPGTGACLGVSDARIVGREEPEASAGISGEARDAGNPGHAVVSGLPRGARPLLSDPLLSRDHVEVRVATGRHGPVLRVRDLGSTNGSRLSRPRRPALDGTMRWRRPRRLGRTWRTAPAGSRLLLGATVLEVRPRPGGPTPSRWTEFAGPEVDTDEHSAPPSRRRLLDAAMRILPSLAMAGMMVPFLAGRDGSPWRWLLLLLPLLILAAGIASILPSAGERPRPRPLDPAALALTVARARHSAEVPAALPWHPPGVSPARLAPGESLGVFGPHARPAALWYALRAWLACPPGTCAVQRADGGSPVPSPAGAPQRTAPAWANVASGPSAGAAVLPAASDAAFGGRMGAASLGGMRRWQIVLAAAGAASAPPLHPGDEGGAVVTIVVARHRHHLPTWCTYVVPAGHGGARDAQRADAHDVPEEDWAAAVLDLAAAPADGRTGAPGAITVPGLPDAGEPVALPALLPADLTEGLRAGGSRASGAVRRAWRRGAPEGRGDLTVALGVGAGGVVTVDLAGDGPHALVAGTTGSGKSEALVTWVLQLALTHDPTHLQLLLLDHKGGATFGPLAGLPHTAGVLTDLDAASTDRALRSLGAEVTRRERLLAELDVRDLRELEAAGRPGPPRLVVIADEFRVLADAHPGLMDGLRRLAAQGRTLGIHLVLATQRPAGALSADLRANIPLRLCLRVVEDADSTDVLGSSLAARLPPAPGLAYLQAGPIRPLRVAWAGKGALTARVVAATRAAWEDLELAGAEPPRRPWAPPLPEVVAREDLARSHGGAFAPGDRGAGLPLGLVDLPDAQALGPARVDVHGGLLVVGDRGSGRTATLRTLLAGALEAGWSTHLVAAGRIDDELLPDPTVRRGTWLSAHDAARTRALLEAILAGGSPRPALVVLDDAEAVADLLDTGRPPGTGLELLERLVRDGGRLGVAVVATGSPGLATPRWTAPLTARLVLAVRDETQAGMLGVPGELRGAATNPGRGVLLTRGPARVVQVALSPAGAAGPAVPVTPDAPPAMRASGAADVLDLRPLPRSVSLHAHGDAARDVPPPWAAAGSDGAGAVLAPLDAARPWAVVGPPGSGRTSVLAALAAWCAAQGRDVARVTGPELHDHARPVPLPADGVLIVDDADAVALARLEDALGRGPRRSALVVTVAEHAVGPHGSGLPARAATAGTVLVLAPSRSGLPEARAAADPHRDDAVVLLHRGRALLTVPATPDAGPSGAPAPRAAQRSR